MSPKFGGFVNGDVCGRQMDDGTVDSVCGQMATWRLAFDWMPDADATACDKHVDEAKSLSGLIYVKRQVLISDELWSRLYGWLGDRTLQPNGAEWTHDALRQMLYDLVNGPLADSLLTAIKAEEAAITR